MWVVGVGRGSGSGLRAAIIGNWGGGQISDNVGAGLRLFFVGGLGGLRSWQVYGLFGFEIWQVFEFVGRFRKSERLAGFSCSAGVFFHNGSLRRTTYCRKLGCIKCI